MAVADETRLRFLTTLYTYAREDENTITVITRPLTVV